MWDTMGAAQFALLALFFGLREHHKLLEIGCGPLRAGRFLISYLKSGHYFGVEPNERAVQLGVEHELGKDMAAAKAPSFTAREDFDFASFGETFDYALSYSLLTHMPPTLIAPLFENVARCFHVDSIFLGTVAWAKGEESIVDEEQWTSLPINRFAPDRLERAASDVGMVLRPLGRVHQAWFAAFFPTNTVAMAAVREMQNVNWSAVTPKWESPPDWAKR
jgi:SAM-dependent methyltransferase